MPILDRYLLRQFLQIFSICFLSMMGLYVVIDAFGHLDSFSAHAKQHGSLPAILGEYYGYRMIGFFDRTSGMLAMIAAMFTITWLQRHQEMTAMMAAGISKFRIVRPLIIAAVVVSLLGVAAREGVIPKIREELARDTKDLDGASGHDLEARYDSQSGILIGGEKVVAAEQRIVKPTIVLPAALAHYGKQLVAADAYYRDASAEHPAGYLLQGIRAPVGLSHRESLRVDDRVVIATPHDTEWLNENQAFVVSDIPFQLLASGSAWRSFASTSELIDQLNSPSTDLGADVRVTVHSRLVQPLMDATLLMLGLPLMFSRSSRNLFLSIGICLLVVVAFSVVTLACHSLGGLGLLPPTLAAWLPLMLFTPLAVAMSHTFRT